MEITNKHNLPEVFRRFAVADKYSRGGARKSITQLIDSPRVDALKRQHWDEIEVDVSERIWALLGTAVHAILEEATPEYQIAEERLFAEHSGWTISGGIDNQEADTQVTKNQKGYTVTDYKVTTAYVVKSQKPIWKYQLNSYAYLLRKAKNIKVTKLQIVAIVRDWSRNKAEQNEEYPQAPIVVVDIPVWGEEQQDKFVADRIDLHQETEIRSMVDEPLPECSAEERWQDPAMYAVMNRTEDTWAVMKPGKSRADKVFDNESDATQHSMKVNGQIVHRPGKVSTRARAVYPNRVEAEHAAEEIGGVVEERPSEPRRCMGDYCGVSRWCEQWAALKVELGIDQENETKEKE